MGQYSMQIMPDSGSVSGAIQAKGTLPWVCFRPRLCKNTKLFAERWTQAAKLCLKGYKALCCAASFYDTSPSKCDGDRHKRRL